MFNKLSFYFFKNLLFAFIIGMAILSLLLFLMQIARFLEVITSRGLPISLLFYLSTLTMQNLWIELMPFVLALSLIFTWITMQNSQELTAIISFGISYARLSLQPFIFSLILVISTFLIGNLLLPKSYINYQIIKQNIDNSYNLKSVEVGKFNQLSDNFSFYVKSIDGDILKEIIIKVSANNSPIILFAQTGKLDTKNKEIVLVLQEVTLQEINDSYNSTSFANLSSYSINLNNKSNNTVVKSHPREFNAIELINSITLKEKQLEFAKLKVRIHKEILSRILSLIIPFLFISISLYYLSRQQFSRQSSVLIYIKIILVLLLIKLLLILANSTFNNIYILLFTLLIIPICATAIYIYKIIKSV